MNYGLANIEQRPQYGLGSFIKKIGKKVKKIIPKEIAPFVPAVAGAFLGPMAGSFLGGMGGIFGSAAAPSMLSGFLGRGLTDAVTQKLTSGRIDPTSALMSGGLGALANYRSPTMLPGKGGLSPSMRKGSFGISKPGGAMDRLLSKGREFGQIGSGGRNPFSAKGFDSALGSIIDAPGKALSVGTTIGAAKAGGDEMAALQKAAEMADASSGGQPQDAETRRKAIRYYMGQAGYTSSEIDDALAASGYASGGRVGYQEGGVTFSDMSGNPQTKEEFLAPLIEQYEAIVNMGGSEALGITEEEAIRELDALYEMRGEQNAMESLPPEGPLPNFADGGNVKPQAAAALTLPNIGLLPGFNPIGIGGGLQPPMVSHTGPSQGGMVGSIMDAVKDGLDDATQDIQSNVSSQFKPQEVLVPANNQQMANVNSSPIQLQNLLGVSNNRMGGPGMGGSQRVPFNEGGGVMPNGDPISPDVPRGMQMDLRGGGFIPLGTKPRADDVPAMVGKDEFVLNDRAVKGIGKLLTGEADPRAGARALYQLQDQMEAMA